MPEKIFCIGFNKTGTSSLQRHIKNAGYTCLHNAVWTEISHYALDHTFEQFFNEYDAFSHGEMANIERLDKRFKNAKYILNVRDLRPWMESRIRWIYRNYPIKSQVIMAHEYLLDSFNTLETWVQRWNCYHRYVLNYFKDRPEDLIIINITKDKSWVNKVNNFLNINDEVNINLHINKLPRHADNPKKQKFIKSKLDEVPTLLMDMGIPETSWNNAITLENINMVLEPQILRQNLSRIVKKWDDKYA